MMHRARLVLVFLGCVSSTLFANTIAGTVTAGASSTPIPSASVVLHGNGHDQSAQTSGDGTFSFSGLQAGVAYSLTVQSEGLRPFAQTAITLNEGETLHIDANMELANVNESIVVTDGVVNLQSTASEIKQTLTSEDLQDLPTVTHSLDKDARLDPHVRQTIGLGSDYQDSTRLSINAGSYRNTGYMLDGTTTYDWIYSVAPQTVVSLGAASDMTVMTGQYPAQYGISTTGILVINTKSGTNNYHGDAFAFIRPSGIQSNPPVSTLHTPNQREDWGGSFGGPIESNRTFFFGSFEVAEQDRGAFIQSPTPSVFDGHTTESYALLRFDHNFSDTNSLTARFNGNHFQSNNVQDRISGFNQPSTGRLARIQSWGGQISDRVIFGNKVNEARFSFIDFFPDSATPLDPSVTISYPNYETTGYSTYSWVHAHTFNFSDVLVVRHGRHEIKVGGEAVHLRAKDFAYTPFGAYSFSATNFTTPSSYSQTFGVQNLHYGENEVSAFVEDNVKLSSRLTANLGLRYEWQSVTDDRNNFAPRLGLAWDVRGDGKTVVRAGAGIFYDQYYMYIMRRFTTLGPNAPQQTITIPYGTAGFPTFPNSLPSIPTGTPAAALNLYLPDSKLLNPYALQFSLSVEQKLARNLTLNISGFSEHTLKQMAVDDINHPAPYPRTATMSPRPGSVADKTRPFYNPITQESTYDGVQVRDVAVIKNNSSSIYQSLDVGLTGRLAHRLQLGAHYVFAASYTYAMFYADANSGIPSEWYPNWTAYERAPDDYYQRNRLVGTAGMQLPFRTEFTLVGTIGSGLPVNPITGTDDNGDTYSTDRPVGFSRNSFRTPVQGNLDIALGKRFKIYERLQAEGRVQAFNILNHQNYLNVVNAYGEGPTPKTNFLAPIAGVANSDPSRQIEFSLRFLF
ncbi:MAG TPA: TonB-dependent receptor [Candidatus Sulfotelmatobacter sp.]|jgi:hypothetical protein